MSEREYVKFNTSVQVASNAQNLIKDDEGNIAAILELRLPDNIFPAENGNKKVDSVQMLATKMRISMENTPIAQFDVDEDTAKKLEKLDRSSNAAFITTSQMDLYPYVIKGDNQILPAKTNSAFPHYRSQILEIQINVWTGTTMPTVDTLYVHPLSSSSFAENIGRYQIPFQKAGLFAAIDHLSNLVVKQYMPVKREDDVVSIFNVGSIEQMLQDGIESAFVYNNTNLNEPLHYEIWFFSEDAYNNNQYPTFYIPFTKKDIDTENSMIFDEMGGLKAFFVNKIAGPDYTVQEEEISNLRYSVKPKVSFTEQKLRISYDTAPFTTNVPLLWCNSFVNTYDNPLQLTLGNVYSDYCDGFKPPKRVFSYGATENRDESYFFTLKQSTINPINIVGNKALRDTFSCLPWITVDTNTNGFFKNKEKAKYRIKEQMQVKTNITTADLVIAKRPQEAPAGTRWRQFQAAGVDCTSIDTALTTNCLVYTFSIPKNAVNTNFTVFNERYPKAKRLNQNANWGTETRLQDTYLGVTEMVSRSNENTTESISEMKTFEQYEHNYDGDFPPMGVNEIYSSSSTEKTVLPDVAAQQPCCGYFNINGEDKMLIYDIPEGNWSISGFRCWLPPVEPDFVSEPVESGDNFNLSAYWNLPQTGIYAGKIILVAVLTGGFWAWWGVSYGREIVDAKTYYKQNVIETLTEASIDDLLFNFLPNVDLDEKGRFYVLDGTTTNLDIGQQEVIEGPTNTLFHITQVSRFIEEKNGVTETWNGTYDGTPYSKIVTNFYNASDSPYVEYDYTLIDESAPDTPSNRTNQRIRYLNVSTDPLTHILDPDDYIEEPTSAARRIAISMSPYPSRTETVSNEWDTSSTNYPVGTTEIGPIYSPWTETNKSITSLQTERRITHIGGINVIYLENSSDEYWYAPSVPDVFRCIPEAAPDEQWERLTIHYQRWYLRWLPEQRTDIIFNVITNSVVRYVDTRTIENRSITVVDNTETEYYGNIRLNFEWDNIPIVVISPIQSIVLTLQGMNVSQEIQPINIAQPGGSSLVSTIPVIENYYSLAQTLRDLHDELVVIKDSYDDQATYSLNTTSGQERALRIMAQYITKDGRLHQIYIPPNGVYSLQLTFAISYYFTS